MMPKTDNKSLEIKFGGDLHEISADLFIESLVCYSLVTQEVSAHLASGAKVNIKIKALQQGSFKVLLDLAAYSTGLFTKENIDLAASVFAIVGGLYGLKKWIAKKGSPETIKSIDEENIEITNNNGNIIINKNVYHIYQSSPKVRENLRNTFIKLKEEEEITDFSIRDVDGNNDIFRVEKKDFSALAADDEVKQKRQKIFKENQGLSIFKIVFKENHKWEFVYEGNKIYASIKDKSYFNKINTGEIAFRSGDKLIVDLEIEQVFNEVVNIFVNDAYHILKVKQHIPRNPLVQYSLDLED